MLVTFRSRAGANITMFGEVAITLLKMMGHSGAVPSALLAADIPAALARLEERLAAVREDGASPGTRPDAQDSDVESPVGLRLRAYPLIQLLSAAARQECDVTWGTSRVAD